MATTRIKDITTAASTFSSDDFVAIDGATSGTRKMAKADLITEVSTGVSGTYLEESNNLSDVASKDTSKLNLEVPDVGTAPNEVPMSGQLGTMAFQDASGVSVEQLEATDKIGIGTNSGTRELTIGDGTGSPNMQLLSSNSGLARIEFGDTDDGDAGELMYDHSNNKLTVNTAGSTAVTVDSSQRVGINTASPDRALHCYSDSVATVLKLDSAGADTGLEFAHSDTVAAGINCSTGGDLEFRTGANSSANQRAVIDSSGRLGVGQSSPGSFNAAADDLVIGDSTGDRGITVSSGDASTGNLFFGDATSGANARGAVTYDHATNALKLGSNGTTRATIDSSGNMTLETGSLTIGTAGKGIYFGATSDAAGMTAELLDDYEEGTWTPALTFGGGATGITYGGQFGYYTRIGDRVFVSGVITLTAVGSSTGTATITGLPETASNATANNRDNLTFSYANGMTGLGGTVVGLVIANATTVNLYQWAASGTTAISNTAFTNSTTIRFNGQYHV